MGRIMSMGAAILATMFLSFPYIAMAETEDVSCVSGLIECQKFLGNTDTPTKICCDPLKDAVKTQLKCLCNLLNDKDLVKGSGIDLTQVIKLPKRCGLSTDIAVCNTVASPSTSTSTSISTPQPKTASGNTTTAAASENATKTTPKENVSAGARGIAGIGIFGLMGFIFFLSSVIYF